MKLENFVEFDLKNPLIVTDSGSKDLPLLESY